MGSEEQNEWYFFSHKDKKYPTYTRTNRATKAGFWKAAGRDKAIYCRHCLVGIRKTLVFCKGRAPNGRRIGGLQDVQEVNENSAKIGKPRRSTMCRNCSCNSVVPYGSTLQLSTLTQGEHMN
ncbi:hypothetical protein V6N13_096085 [Hibiscus sabdariffa]|uniref:NAC domain-containing protein n=1 Tax=Hibiscus sabdariffa TaxID=183260 RepID=A0ABR2DHR0_9ROSI